MTPLEIVQLATSLALLTAGLCAFLFWALRPGSRLRARADEHDPGCEQW